MGRMRRPVRDAELAAELIQLRCSAGLTQKTAGALAGWSESRISRIENCMSPIELGRLPDLLDVYDPSTELRTRILDLAEYAAEPSQPARPYTPSASKLDLILEQLIAIRQLLDKQAADRPARTLR